jgi:hypothetical protein
MGRGDAVPLCVSSRSERVRPACSGRSRPSLPAACVEGWTATHSTRGGGPIWGTLLLTRLRPLIGLTGRSYRRERQLGQGAANAEARGLPEDVFSSPTPDSRATEWDRWDRWYCRPFWPIRAGSPAHAGPICQYQLLTPNPVEYHRSHRSHRRSPEEDGIGNHDGSLGPVPAASSSIIRSSA